MSDVDSAVRARYGALDRIHGDDPRTAFSRVVGNADSLAGLSRCRPVTYEEAVHAAALAVNLALVVGRAEEADPSSGGPD